jgi:glycosyltransferase involved in cell wall biosynthesis
VVETLAKFNKNCPILSIVIPMFNESESIKNTIQVIETHIKELHVNYEIILVDDGSRDETLNICMKLSEDNRNLRVIKIENNVGHMRALETGLIAANGDYIVSIDADLQDNPKEILAMFKIIQQTDDYGNRKFDVIQTVRNDRQSDKRLKRMTARMYYKLMERMTGHQILRDGADFRMITRETLEIIKSIPEKEKVFRLLLPALGFRVGVLETRRENRFAGSSKYGYKKMFGLAINSVINFSNRPLRLIIQLGIISMTLMLMFCGVAIYLWSQGRTIPGWTSLVILILISNSLILISLGVVGEYVGKVFEQVKGRPNTVWTELGIGQKDE